MCESCEDGCNYELIEKQKKMIRRTDANHKELIDLIRQIPGTSVFSTHEVGKGFPDIVVGYRGLNYMFEIKDGAKSPSQKKLTQAEQKLHISWKGQIDVVENIDDVLKTFKTCKG
jgi:hypothetical protein